MPETLEDVERAVAADALKPRSMFEHFDDLSLDVMQKNNALLLRESLENTKPEDMAKASLSFDLNTGPVHTDGPKCCSLDLVEACKAAWAKNGSILPSNNIVLDKLTIT